MCLLTSQESPSKVTSQESSYWKPKEISVKLLGSTKMLVSKGSDVATKIKEEFQIPLVVELIKFGSRYLINHAMTLATFMFILLVIPTIELVQPAHLLEHLFPSLPNAAVASAAATALALIIRYFLKKQQLQPIYVVDFACYKPEDNRKGPAQLLEYFAKRSGTCSAENLEFQKKVYLKSGIGEETYLPPFIFHDPPIQPSMKQARLEAEEVMFGAMDELLEKTGLNPQDIDILIVSCSCFTPTPSLASMVVNHYKMRSNVCSLNLGGMGCSGGMVAVDLAKHLLRSFASSNAVIINTENITLNWYRGNNRSMLISNCLFRVGAAAILLSNKRSERNRAKYQLHCSVRTHTAADDKAFQSAFQEEDEDGLVGISLSKHIMIAAADAIKENMTHLGSLVLPYSEQLRFLISCFSPKIFQTAGKAYVPNFKLAFQHFLIHTGGRAVLDGIQNKLSLSNDHMEASRMTLHRFGNTSSSSIWYALAYLEAKERVKKSDRIWLVGLGAGFKCNSVVLKALRTVKQPSMNPWLDCLHKYPMKISTEMTDIFRSDKLLYRTNSGKLFDCMKGQRIETDHV